jgi:hypothetical protein
MIAIPVSGMIGGPISGALMGLTGWLGLVVWQLGLLVFISISFGQFF